MNPVEVLGQERLNHYEHGSFPLDKALSFFNGVNKYRDNMIGLEFEFKMFKHLESVNAKNINIEVFIDSECGTTFLDATAEIDGEVHSFEAKCQKKLNSKCIKQIKKAKTGNYSKVHVFIAADTSIPLGIGKKLQAAGADVIRSNMTRQDIINELLNIQKLMS